MNGFRVWLTIKVGLGLVEFLEPCEIDTVTKYIKLIQDIKLPVFRSDNDKIY